MTAYRRNPIEQIAKRLDGMDKTGKEKVYTLIGQAVEAQKRMDTEASNVEGLRSKLEEEGISYSDPETALRIRDHLGNRLEVDQKVSERTGKVDLSSNFKIGLGREKMSENNSSSGRSAVGIFLGLGSMSAGAYHGYCDAQGIPFQRENLEFALTYAPAIIQGTVFGLTGLVQGAAIGAKEGGCAGVVVGAVGGSAVLGGIGTVVGGLETLFGYGVGYFAGYLAR